MIKQMDSNITRLSLGSVILLNLLACNQINKAERKEAITSKDTCVYNASQYDKIIFDLSCQNCHLKYGGQIEKIPTFETLSILDSLKLVDYVFTKKHKGWYTKNGAFKSNRLDSLSNCDIKNIIHYIKDYGKPQAPVPDGKK